MLIDFMEQLKKGWQGDCPHCGRFAKLYYRQIHVSVALQLIQLYKLGGEKEYIHVSRLIAKGVSGPADFTKAKHWSLIEEKADDIPDGKKSSGFWRLTSIGVEFVKGGLKVKKIIHVYDARVIDATGPLVSIQDCLQNKFNYQELMEGGPI